MGLSTVWCRWVSNCLLQKRILQRLDLRELWRLHLIKLHNKSQKVSCFQINKIEYLSFVLWNSLLHEFIVDVVRWDKGSEKDISQGEFFYLCKLLDNLRQFPLISQYLVVCNEFTLTFARELTDLTNSRELSIASNKFLEFNLVLRTSILEQLCRKLACVI